MLVALTNSDETNMVACQVAHTLFSTPTRVARVRAADYLAHPRLFDRDNMAVDVLISPERLVPTHIQRMIEIPGALEELAFADARAQMVGMRAFFVGSLVGHELRTLPVNLPAASDDRGT